VAGARGELRWDEFMRLALYHPTLGYYQRSAARVGRAAEADFYTATSLGPVFGEAIAAAARARLETAGLAAAQCAFVEIGAEPGGGVLMQVPAAAHGFGELRTVRLGEDWASALQGPCVVFSNELFDAQPVRRFRWAEADGAWRELGVRVEGAELVETTRLLARDDEARAWLPPQGEGGQVVDAPRAATQLAEELMRAGHWHGVFIACDYGKSWAELSTACPAGTLRAYYRHAQQTALLAAPGEQDLTAHVCWDWLAEALIRLGAREVVLESQEAFLVKRAGQWLAQALTLGADQVSASLDPRRRALMHLLHPAQMGQKFQVLHALK
jgi:SAM-dependent MidA family methyltransferase